MTNAEKQIPPLRGPTRQNTARKKISGRSGPFGCAQGRRNDKIGKGTQLWIVRAHPSRRRRAKDGAPDPMREEAEGLVK